jgi:hypothetical protein
VTSILKQQHLNESKDDNEKFPQVSVIGGGGQAEQPQK